MDLTFSPPLYQLVEAFLRARGSPGAGSPQGENQLTKNEITIEIKAIEKGQKEFTIIFFDD